MRPKALRHWTAAIALGFLALAVSARAQISPKSNGPIDITADQAEAINSKCQTIWSGSAEALQGDTRLRADVIKAFLKQKGVDAQGQSACGATDRIEADGHVYYVTPTQSARGDHAVYSADAGEIVMTGNVIVVQGQNVVVGDRLTIMVATREAKMDSNVVGAGRQGRVRGVFYPNQPGGPQTPVSNPGH
jgi:lipopolysaccharide export system protein LptA